MIQVYLTATNYLEDINANIKVMHMEKNKDNYANTNSFCQGNCHFYLDMKNGTLYNQSTYTTGLRNFTLSNQAKDNLENSLPQDIFSTGVYTTTTGGDIRIKSKDNSVKSRRPVIVVTYSVIEDLTYDGNGNLIEGFGKKFTYDSWNHMIEINYSTTGKPIARYWYDHEGQRIKKTVYGIDVQGNNLSSYYMNSRPADFIHNRITNGTIYNETYIYLYDKLIAKIDNNNRKFFYHPDHLGSTTLVTNESGAVVENIQYLPFGSILNGSDAERFLYTGQEYDKESELLYYGARYYDSDFKRFIQPDPVIQDVYDPQNLNRYSYVLNNPYRYKDESGNFPVLVIGAVIGIYIGIDYGVELFQGLFEGRSFAQSYEAGAQRAGESIGRAATTSKGAGEFVLNFAAGEAAAAILGKIGKADEVVKIGRNPKIKSDFLKLEAEKPGAIEKYGEEGVNAMKQGKNPSGFQVHHKEPLYAGGTDDASNLEVLPKGSGSNEHPGTHTRGGEAYNQYGPPQNYRNNQQNQQTSKGFVRNLWNWVRRK